MTGEIEERERRIAHYSVLLNSWIENRMARDKALITLSSGAIALLVTVLTTVGVQRWWEVLLFSASFISFGICIWTSLKIYQLNSQAIENELKRQDSTNLKLESFDRRTLYSFIFGVVFLGAIGISSAVLKILGERAMAKDTESESQQVQVIKKSLDGLHNIRPEVIGDPERFQGSVIGIDKLRPEVVGPTGPGDGSQQGGSSGASKGEQAQQPSDGNKESSKAGS